MQQAKESDSSVPMDGEDGEWMRNWVKQMQDAGAEVVGGEDAICCDAPDDEAEEKLVELGKKLAE